MIARRERLLHSPEVGEAADVGISVDTAVDIAKESADAILLEKDLMVLEAGVMEEDLEDARQAARSYITGRAVLQTHHEPKHLQLGTRRTSDRGVVPRRSTACGRGSRDGNVRIGGRRGGWFA